MTLPDFSKLRVLCVGDVMLDRFMEGSVRRISPESPVPILEMSDVVNVPGGAANVGRNICALGARCTLIGAVGADAAGNELQELLRSCDGLEPALATDPSRPTVEKIRYVAVGQHLLRVDREKLGDVSAETASNIVGKVRDRIADHQVVVLSDYAKGVLSDAVIGEVVEIAAHAGVPVVVDPKSARLQRYAGATVVTPNGKEATGATGIDVGSDSDAQRAAAKILSDADIEAVLITRSEHGMTLAVRDGDVVHVPASGREVFDVVGAGDTVVAALALCLGAGASMVEAVRVANAAAGVVVGKHGTATVSRSELVDELQRLNNTGAFSEGGKVLLAADVASLRAGWERDGLRVGFTNGCFDILHIGHVRMLEFARSQCDRLIVGLNSDASVKRLKGPSRPVNNEEDRAHMLGAFGFVDAVVVFEEDTPYSLIEQLQPDILVKGSDYRIEEVVGYDIVQARGGNVVTFELVPGRSTSSIIARATTAAEVVA